MTKAPVVVTMSISLDGFGAGLSQSESKPMDELRLQISPVVAGRGIRLFDGVDRLDLEQLDVRATTYTTHVHYRAQR